MFHVTDASSLPSIVRGGLAAQTVSGAGAAGVWLFYDFDDWNTLADMLGKENPVVIEVDVDEHDLLADEDAIGPPGSKELYDWLEALAPFRETYATFMAGVDDDDTVAINQAKTEFITKYHITPDMAPEAYVGHESYRSARINHGIPLQAIIKMAAFDWDTSDWLPVYDRSTGINQRNFITATAT